MWRGSGSWAPEDAASGETRQHSRGRRQWPAARGLWQRKKELGKELARRGGGRV